MDKEGFLKSVGMEFRIERIRQGLTQSQLANLCGLNQRTICVIETGSESSRVHILKRVADALEKPLSHFI